MGVNAPDDETGLNGSGIPSLLADLDDGPRRQRGNYERRASVFREKADRFRARIDELEDGIRQARLKAAGYAGRVGLIYDPERNEAFLPALHPIILEPEIPEPRVEPVPDPPTMPVAIVPAPPALPEPPPRPIPDLVVPPDLAAAQLADRPETTEKDSKILDIALYVFTALVGLFVGYGLGKFLGFNLYDVKYLIPSLLVGAIALTGLKVLTGYVMYKGAERRTVAGEKWPFALGVFVVLLAIAAEMTASATAIMQMSGAGSFTGQSKIEFWKAALISAIIATPLLLASAWVGWSKGTKARDRWEKRVRAAERHDASVRAFDQSAVDRTEAEYAEKVRLHEETVARLLGDHEARVARAEADAKAKFDAEMLVREETLARNAALQRERDAQIERLREWERRREKAVQDGHAQAAERRNTEDYKSLLSAIGMVAALRYELQELQAAVRPPDPAELPE